jgi:drug/metabolite transporter (DMT)-like permease
MQNKGLIYAILASLFLSTGFVFAKHFLQYANPATLNVLWFWIAFVVSTAILLVRDRLKTVRTFKEHWKDGFVVGGANAFAAIFWFESINVAGPTLSAFLLRFSTIFIIFLGVLFLKEKLHIQDVVGTLIALTGAFAISFTLGNYLDKTILVPLAAAFAISVHQVLAKFYVKNIDPLSLVSFRVFYTAVFLTIFAVATSQLHSFPINQLPQLVGAVIINAVIGFVLLYKALELLDVSKVAIIRTLDPFIVVIFAFAVFQTFPSTNQLIGGSLVITGVLVTIFGHNIKTLMRITKVPWIGS